MRAVYARSSGLRVPSGEPWRSSSTREDRIPHKDDPGVRLLELEPDLGARLSDADRAEARREVVLPTAAIPRGPWTVETLERAGQVRGEVTGFLVLRGVVTMEVSVLDRTCVRLIGSRELILLDTLPTDALPVTWGWAAHAPTDVAIFDDRLLVIGKRWPRLLSTILERAAHQTRQTLLQQAISQLPRVEDRIRALFWVIAERQGLVRADGVFVPLAVTHELIAQMIGGQRPTVSLGLTRLAEQGLLRPVEGGWLLHPASREDISVPASRPPSQREADRGSKTTAPGGRAS